MKKLKTLSARVQTGSGKVVKKKTKLKEIPMKTNTVTNSDDFDDDFDNPKPVEKLDSREYSDDERVMVVDKNSIVPEKRIKWSSDEDRYVNFCVERMWNSKEPVSHECLGNIATRVNKKFHAEKPVRNNSSLWWHIQAKQKKGADVFASFSIMPGSPYPNKVYGNGPPLGHNSIGNKLGSRVAAKQEITGAVRAPIIPARPPAVQTGKQSPSKNPQTQARKKLPQPSNVSGKKMTIEVLVKSPDGQFERFSTNKFGSLNEMIFALA